MKCIICIIEKREHFLEYLSILNAYYFSLIACQKRDVPFRFWPNLCVTLLEIIHPRNDFREVHHYIPRLRQVGHSLLLELSIVPISQKW